jgi:hypothetical protein
MAKNNRRRLAWLILLVLVIAVVAIVLTPMYLIAPFKAQTQRVLAVSYLMCRWSPFLTIVASLVILTLMIRLWVGGHWWNRAILVLLLLPVLGATWLARQNHFEWMFNPLPNPAYAKAAEAAFVKDDDRVMAVRLGEESVAYPITLLAYHHVLGDTVGDTPIVATY